MATHDYVIANGTGAAVRSDLNNALAAIVSNNSSSSAPSTTYAYQFWADTNTNILKIRNSANNGWVKLRELDGTMLIDDGSVSTPGLAFGSDLNTGISRSASNKINFSTQGIERLEIGNSEFVVNDSGSVCDFRVESQAGTHALFVKADTDRVGIGKSTPNAKLHITSADSSVNPNASADDLFVESDGNTGITIGSPAANTGRISFGDSADAQVGKILYDHSSNFLSFDTAGSERLRINNGGKVLVNTTAVLESNAAAKLQIQADTGAQLALGRDGTGVVAGDDIGKISFYGNDAGSYQKCAEIRCEADGSHADDDKPSRLQFRTTADGASSPTERMRITQAGHILANTTSVLDLGSGSTSGINLNASNIIVASRSNGESLSLQRTNSNGNIALFFKGTSSVGGISVNNSATSFNTSSDYRLKENVVDLSDAITRVKQLAPKRFNFIVDAETTVDGFLAHEAQTVVPEAVTGTHNEVDDDSNPVYQGIDQSKLVPLLTAALQEAIAKIETLETKVAALEAG